MLPAWWVLCPSPNQCSKKRHQTDDLSLHYVRIQSPSSQEGSSHQKKISQHRNHRFSSLQNYDKYMFICKLPSFVVLRYSSWNRGNLASLCNWKQWLMTISLKALCKRRYQCLRLLIMQLLRNTFSDACDAVHSHWDT